MAGHEGVHAQDLHLIAYSQVRREVLFLSLAAREWDQGMVIHDLFNIHSSP